MDCTTATTQAEFDAAIAAEDVECVHIEAPAGVWIQIGPVNGTRVEIHKGVGRVANGGRVGRVANGGRVTAGPTVS